MSLDELKIIAKAIQEEHPVVASAMFSAIGAELTGEAASQKLHTLLLTFSTEMLDLVVQALAAQRS